MNRCTSDVLRSSARRLLLGASVAALFCSTLAAHAQSVLRTFPLNAQRGVMTVTYPPIIQLNGKEDRLSPGARIRGANGLLVLSGNIIGQSLVVNYVREPLGLVHEVWILTPEEAALKLPTQN